MTARTEHVQHRRGAVLSRRLAALNTGLPALLLTAALAAVLILMPTSAPPAPLDEPAPASSGGEYDLGWWSVDAGGGTSSGGTYSLAGTIGQADASASGALSGGSYTLSGGILAAWADGAANVTWNVWLPLLMR
jgi:hypothetical protein